MASIISGTATAEQLMADLAHDVSNFTQSHGAPPTLAAVLVGDDPASDIYVRRKIEQCRKIGMRSLEHRYGADCTEAELLRSEEHTSELQSLMRISHAVLCLKKTTTITLPKHNLYINHAL